MEESHRNYLPPEYRDLAAAPTPKPAETEPATPVPTNQSAQPGPASASPAPEEKGKDAAGAFEGIARFLSTLFSPLLMATYGLLLAMTLSYLVYSPLKVKAIVVGVTFVATCAIPIICIFVLSRIGAISDATLNARKDRGVPYVVAALCYLGVAVYYHFVNAPVWLSMFMAGGGVALLVMALINRKWKISAHGCGTGGLCGLVFYLMISGDSVDSIQWVFMLTALVAGCVGTSRLILRRHTPWQVAAGFALGFVAVFCPAWVCTMFNI